MPLLPGKCLCYKVQALVLGLGGNFKRTVLFHETEFLFLHFNHFTFKEAGYA